MTCPRCNGLMVDNYGEPYCLNCGYRQVVPVRETVVDEVVRGARVYRKRRFIKKGADR